MNVMPIAAPAGAVYDPARTTPERLSETMREPGLNEITWDSLVGAAEVHTGEKR